MHNQTVTEPDEVIQLKAMGQAQFKKNYDQLLAGVNRIRYIKTKQKRNQLKMMHYLNTLSKNIQKRKEKQFQSAPKMENSFKVPILNVRKSIQLKQIRSPFKNNLTFEANQTSVLKSDHQKMFHYSFQGKYKNGCFDSKPTEVTTNGSLIADVSLQTNKQKLAQLLFKKKTENYQEMKQLKLKHQEYQRQKQQALLQAARIRREVVKTSYENGRKRINQQYFQHLQSIKQAKAEDKKRKLRQTEKKYQQLIEMQQIEKEELEKYEHSLIMESNLKELIELANKDPTSKRLFREFKHTFQ